MRFMLVTDRNELQFIHVVIVNLTGQVPVVLLLARNQK